MLLFLFSIILSFVSTCLMSYLALGIEVTFWVAPICSLIAVFIFLQLSQNKFAKEYSVIALAAGSIGGMIGLSIGFSWPTLYFLHKRIFLSWMESPVCFASMIGFLVAAAGFFAAILAYCLRQYLIIKGKLNFPTVSIVNSIIYQNRKLNIVMMSSGIAVSFIWSSIAILFRASLHGFLLLQIHTIPTLITMGFVAGHLIAKPLFIGMLLRFLALFGTRDNFFYDIEDDSFILTFALGMLFALIVLSVCMLLKNLLIWLYFNSKNLEKFKIVESFKNRYFWLFSMFVLLFCYFVLQYWNITLFQQCYILIALSFATMIVAYIFGQVGVLDLPNFGSFIIIPFFYLFSVSSEVSLIAFIFCTICMGLVINILFSWKLADLSKISFVRLVKYQTLGFIVAVVSIGFIIWWYATVLNLGSNPLFSEQSLLQERFITLAVYDYRIFLLGFFSSAILYFLFDDVSIIIAGCMMPFSVAVWLIFAGSLSYLVKNRIKYYPFCFGIYASHAIWLFVQALLL